MTTSSLLSSPHAARATAPKPGAQPGPADRAPTTKEEAARQFESVLVRQFVEVMTKKMFDAPLSGQDGPGWMNNQRDTQRDMMTDVLTDHLVDRGALQLSDLLLRKWEAGAAQPEEAPTEETPAPATPSTRAPLAPLTTSDAPAP